MDRSTWAFDIGASGWGNRELEYYTDRNENVRVENGRLVIEARKEHYSGSEYTSARIKSYPSKGFQYGYFAAKMRTPKGQGIWPAWWMLGMNFPTVGWPKCGEIDILEIIGGTRGDGDKGDDLVHGAFHWGTLQARADHGGGYDSPTSLSQSFHIYELEWTPEKMTVKLDGHPYVALDIQGIEEFHKPLFFLFNVAVGGNWGGYPDASTVFPQKLEVDWVRVYQR